MGAEVGATTSAFPYTRNMEAYLRATGRAPVADAANRASRSGYLRADEGVEYDEVIEIVRSIIQHAMHFWFTASRHPTLTYDYHRTHPNLTRTFPNSSLRLMVHLHLISLHHSPNSANLSNKMAGRMKSLLG